MKIANFSCCIEHNQEVIGESNTHDSFFVVILREFSMQKEREREKRSKNMKRFFLRKIIKTNLINVAFKKI